MSKTVVIGGGGHAKVLISLLNKMAKPVVGYTDPDDQGSILGARWLGDDDVLSGLSAGGARHDAVIGVGKVDASSLRLQICSRVEALGLTFPAIVSPHAIVNEDVAIGGGSVVLDAAVVNTGTMIGRFCILNTSSTVEHDCRLGDNVHLAPGVTLSGGVTIGANTMVGVGSSIVHGIAVCGDCLICAGSTVTRDITTPGVYAGAPCRRVK
jgi:sugar O-acyltransferase (sialic acid O-acetyltransferase NeuD family)